MRTWRNFTHVTGIFLRGYQDAIETRQQTALHFTVCAGKATECYGGWPRLHDRAALLQDGLYIVQIEHDGIAEPAGNIDIRRTPEMLDHGQRVAAMAEGRAQLPGQPRIAIDQRRRSAQKPAGIASYTSQFRPRMIGQREHVDLARELWRNFRRRVFRAPFTESDYVECVASRQIFKQRRASQRAPARYRIRRLRCNDERGRFSGRIGVALRHKFRASPSPCGSRRILRPASAPSNAIPSSDPGEQAPLPWPPPMQVRSPPRFAERRRQPLP